MESKQVRKFDMLRRVQQFLDDSAVKLPGVNATAARKELDAIVQEMALSETAQATGKLNARGETATQAKLRLDLWKHHLKPLAAIAAAHLRQVPGFKALQAPKYTAKAAEMVQAAVAMADAARAHRQVFIDNGLAEGFADELVAAAGAMRASIDTRAKSIMDKAAARKSLNTTSKRADVVLRLLDARVKSILVDDAKALAAWRSAKRIGRGKVVPIGVTAPAAPAQTAEVKAA
jgi:hypothetical protein